MNELVREVVFAADVLLAAGERGFVFHEEKSGSHSRFSVILPDTRLVSSVRYEPRLAALETICRTLVPYLAQFDPRNRIGPPTVLPESPGRNLLGRVGE